LYNKFEIGKIQKDREINKIYRGKKKERKKERKKRKKKKEKKKICLRKALLINTLRTIHLTAKKQYEILDRFLQIYSEQFLFLTLQDLTFLIYLNYYLIV
jgi:hypothetical protein